MEIHFQLNQNFCEVKLFQRSCTVNPFSVGPTCFALGWLWALGVPVPRGEAAGDIFSSFLGLFSVTSSLKLTQWEQSLSTASQGAFCGAFTMFFVLGEVSQGCRWGWSSKQRRTITLTSPVLLWCFLHVGYLTHKAPESSTSPGWGGHAGQPELCWLTGEKCSSQWPPSTAPSSWASLRALRSWECSACLQSRPGQGCCCSLRGRGCHSDALHMSQELGEHTGSGFWHTAPQGMIQSLHCR